jgi:hypothetical protein
MLIYAKHAKAGVFKSCDNATLLKNNKYIFATLHLCCAAKTLSSAQSVQSGEELRNISQAAVKDIYVKSYRFTYLTKLCMDTAVVLVTL